MSGTGAGGEAVGGDARSQAVFQMLQNGAQGAAPAQGGK